MFNSRAVHCSRVSFGFAILALAALWSAPSARAASYTWAGADGGSWNNNANWTPNTGHPVAGDTAIFPAAMNSTTPITLDANQAVTNMTINGTGTITFNSGTGA